MATITDNVAVAAASLWWNGQEFPMQLMGPDRYYAIVPNQLNGVVGNFHITAVDPSDNLAVWPDSGDASDRIRFLQWINRVNTRLALEPVNTALGSFFTQHLDVAAPGPGMRFEFKRSYNSVAGALDGPLGFGWTHNFNLHAQFVDDPLLHGVVITFEDGRVANFETDGGSYRSPAGEHSVLEHEGGGLVLTRPNQIKYHFDSNGKLTSVEDSNGNRILLMYNGDNLTQLTDTAGRVYRLEYDGAHIARITDVLNRTYAYSYDGAGNLTIYQDPEGGKIQYAYNGEHWMTSITDPNNNTFVNNSYDDRGRVVSQQDASHNTSTINYPDESVRIVTDNESNPTTNRYDDKLRIVEEKNALGKSITYQYDDDNNPIKVVDCGGHPTEYTYDAQGNMLTRKDALNQTAYFQYDAHNNKTYEKDESGAETHYEYDGHNNLTRVLDAESGETVMTYDSRGLRLTLRNANGKTTRYEYDAQGNLIRSIDARNQVTNFEYDAVGRRTAMIDANSHTVRFEYDKNDRVKVITDPKTRTTRFVYDAVGNLKSVTDRRGYPTTYDYNENDSLIKVTDPRLYYTAFTYDKMYHRKSVRDRNGNVTRYDYDPVYNLVQVTDAKGNPTTYVYDDDNNLHQIVDALNQLTTFSRDELHRVKKMTNALNADTVYTYDPMGRVKSVLDPKGGLTQYDYDRLGRLKKLTDALTNATRFNYDAVGNRVEVVNARGNSTNYAYDEVNRLVAQTDPLAHTRKLEYDGVGNLVKLTDARNNPTFYQYEENDNLAQVTDARNGVLKYTYDEEDHRRSSTDQNGNTTTFEYDEVGNRTLLRLPLGQETRFTYDGNNNLIAVKNAKTNTTEFTYDELNLLKTRKNPLSFVTTNEYDKLRRLVQVTDAESHATSYKYDPLDRLIQVIDALTFATTYAYDPLGNLTAYTDANGNTTHFDVDLLGRVKGETNPLTQTWRYEYDEVGNRVRRLDARGVTTNYVFDQDNRLTQIVYPNAAQNVAFAYDANDNLIGLQDASGATAFVYDELNRLTSAQRNIGILAGKTLRYEYDPASNRIGVFYPENKSARYAYNANNWLTNVTDGFNGVTEFEYDAVGLPLRVKNPNGTWSESVYDAADRLTRLFNGKPDASSNLISSFDYTLDKVGNRTRAIEKVTRGQVVTYDKQYTYDPLYRLKRAVETPDTKPQQALTSEFVYDKVGNRLSQTTNIADQPNTPALNPPRTTQYQYNAANQLLSAGAAQFTYDANGNRATMSGPDRAINYAYDFENRLARAETFNVLNKKQNADAVLDFVYDGLGRRMERGVSDKGARKTGDYLYDGLGYDLLGEYVNPGSPRTTYYYRDLARVLSRQEIQGDGSGLQYFHHLDGLGSVSAWTNQAGHETQEYKYAPYGRLMDNNGPDNSSNRTDPHNVMTFSGKLWDKETELYHYGARDYDPTNGVWLIQDAYHGMLGDPTTLHRYGYVRDNPINLVDPLGTTWLGDIWQKVVNGLFTGKWETDAQRQQRVLDEQRAIDEAVHQKMLSLQQLASANLARTQANKLRDIGYRTGPNDSCYLYVRTQRAAIGEDTPGWNSAGEIIAWIKEFPGMPLPPTRDIGEWWEQEYEKYPNVKDAQGLATAWNNSHKGSNLTADQFYQVARDNPPEVTSIMLETSEVSNRINNTDIGHVSLVDDLYNPNCQGGWHIREGNFPYNSYSQHCVFLNSIPPSATTSAQLEGTPVVVHDPYFIYGGPKLQITQ